MPAPSLIAALLLLPLAAQPVASDDLGFAVKLLPAAVQFAIDGPRQPFVGVVLVGVLYSRLVFVLPAASLNESLGYVGSWRLTDGNTFRILAIMLPVVIVLMMMAIVTSAVVMPQVTLRPTLLPLLLGSLVNQAVAFASTAIAVTALSLIYRQLRPQAPATIH